MRLVIVTGMSGSGKRTAMKMLEDAGYYCVDNLPVQLIDTFVDLVSEKNTELQKVALGVDVRADQPFEEVVKTIDKIRERKISLEILFLESSEDVLLRRYKETRRMHPLSVDGRVEEGIRREKEILSSIRNEADYIIDTSNLLTRKLKEKLDRIFVIDKEHHKLIVDVVSFGFKHGILQDADLVFDVRFLPNPFYIADLKNLTGLDKPVQDYVMNFEDAGIFLRKIEDLLDFLLPKYISEGKYQIVIAIGCTGGHHRSVTLAGKLYDLLDKKGKYRVRLFHRDIKIEG